MSGSISITLSELREALLLVGNAYSALDRGHQESADALFAEAAARMRAAWARSPEQLAHLLPEHADALRAGAVDSHWSSCLDAVEAVIRRESVAGALREMRDALNMIASVYDYIDKLNQASSDSLFAGGADRMRAAWARAPEQLAQLLPEYANMVQTGSVVDHWSSCMHAVDAALAKLDQQ